ncbi:hypothetical protein L0668_14845 [Paraglaciecola aquimarina]|uniref:DUF560 domain-containing protein n=1 Tax=Paraglaciecola algarum TaxID=3050085 RepID=A0ABS9DAI4_9ALTE|nr:hypothetical protein [Paraglaciecola sp. G1-23]MCF2949395.1 hypothetical protein [Paraglaciecola sp. G1-23]
MKRLFCCVLGAVFIPQVVANQDDSFTFSGQASAGYMYNSALTVEEIDAVNTQGDNGTKIEGTLGAIWKPTDKFKLASGVGYSQEQYHEFEQFDLSLQRFYMDSSYKLTDQEIGLRYDKVNALLQNDKFLSFQQLSLYHGQFLTSTTYFRTSGNLKEKSFPTLSERDADNYGVAADLFYFADGTNLMLTAGIGAEKEQATDEQFDFVGLSIKSKISQKFSFMGLDNKIGLGWKYKKKDYQQVLVSQESELGSTQEIVERDQYRSVVTADWQLNVTDYILVKTQVEYGDYHGKLSQQTYQQSMFNVSFGAKFN